MNSALSNPSVSLEEVLDLYIRKYSLRVSRSLNEPFVVTDKRTKLQILEESAFANPTISEGADIRAYIQTLRGLVAMFDQLAPETLAAMKEKENHQQ